ncbi:MAG: protein-tyrosine phosphatase family protein [Dehalococcoidia bacterium]
MELFEILEGQLYQSGAVEGAGDWQPIHDRKIDVVVDLFGTLDPDVPTQANSILYLFWPIEDHAELPDLRMLDALTDLAVREIREGHKVLAHCHKGKSRSGLFNAIVVMKLRSVDGQRAIDIVRQGRPEALGNTSFVAYLESLSAPSPRRPPESAPA